MGTHFRRSAKSTSLAHWQLKTEKELGGGGGGGVLLALPSALCHKR